MLRKYSCLLLVFALTGCASVPETQRDMFTMVNPSVTCALVATEICIINAPADYATQIQEIRTLINNIPIHDTDGEAARTTMEHASETGEILPLPKVAPGPERHTDAPIIFIDFAYPYGNKTAIKVVTSDLRWHEDIESIDGSEEHFYLVRSSTGYEILDHAVSLICLG